MKHPHTYTHTRKLLVRSDNILHIYNTFSWTSFKRPGLCKAQRQLKLVTLCGFPAEKLLTGRAEQQAGAGECLRGEPR